MFEKNVTLYKIYKLFPQFKLNYTMFYKNIFFSSSMYILLS